MASTLFVRSALRAAQTAARVPRVARVAPAFASARLFSSTKLAFDQPRLRLGSTAPNFSADSTHGPIDFHEFIGDKWTVLFSHPADFTPVCTTELGAFAQLEPEFAARGCKLIGLSVDAIGHHAEWIKDIEEVATNGAKVGFPIVADPDRKIALLYDMIDEKDIGDVSKAFTIRSVFVIDPSKKIRLTMLYPASTGRNSAEVLRVLDGLQTADKNGIATPINWTPGGDVIIPPTVSDADAKAKFGEFNAVKPYLRYTKV
ncbi:mitochondrial peroxiredoxin PRX1, partial [Dipodascopsis tothii]|uniref:mitochondrial peroxiredoxin PRX1 n=1 Tax=Dipodascopsis tothii TaxID=44089 RepID=UPI0034CFF278